MNPHEALYTAARPVLPGGVSSSIRFNQALGRPFYIARGEGAYVYDLEGREYVDLLTAHGATILGHNHPGIRAATTPSPTGSTTGCMPSSRRRAFGRAAQGLGARFGPYFGFTEEVRTYRDTDKQDTAMALRFFKGMAERGVYFCDGGGKPMHHGFSAAHTLADMGGSSRRRRTP